MFYVERVCNVDQFHYIVLYLYFVCDESRWTWQHMAFGLIYQGTFNIKIPQEVGTSEIILLKDCLSKGESDLLGGMGVYHSYLQSPNEIFF